MSRIPADAVLTVSFDVRAVTPEGSEHLFTHVATLDADATLETVAEHLAELSIDAAEAFLELARGTAPDG